MKATLSKAPVSVSPINVERLLSSSSFPSSQPSSQPLHSPPADSGRMHMDRQATGRQTVVKLAADVVGIEFGWQERMTEDQLPVRRDGRKRPRLENFLQCREFVVLYSVHAVYRSISS